MTVTKHPTREELNCLHCGMPGPELDIDHVQNRGMGGSKKRDVPENKVPLCRPCHELKTVGEVETEVQNGVYGWRWRGRVWVTFSVHVDKRHKCLVKSVPDSAAGEDVTGEESVMEASPSPSAPSGSGSPAVEQQQNIAQPQVSTDGNSTAEPPVPVAPEGGRDGQIANVGGGGDILAGDGVRDRDASPVGSGVAEGGESASGKNESAMIAPRAGRADKHGSLVMGEESIPSAPPPSAGVDAPSSPPKPSTAPAGITHEKRLEICSQIRWMQQNRQWHTGDTANEWEKELGEDFWNVYANEFGYAFPSLRNAMRVCERIPENQRHYLVSFGHHAAIYALNLEDRDAWLDRTEDEGWNISQLTDVLRAAKLLPPKPRVKRWTLEELRRLYEETDYCFHINEWLDFLEEQT